MLKGIWHREYAAKRGEENERRHTSKIRTKKELRVEICSQCHPFFTGKQKLVDTGGRVDRFKKKYGIE